MDFTNNLHFDTSYIMVKFNNQITVLSYHRLCVSIVTSSIDMHIYLSGVLPLPL